MGDWCTDALRLWAHIVGDYAKVVEGVEIYYYKDIPAWDKKHGRKAAFALGNIVMFRSSEELTPASLRHELKHCEQIKARGGLVQFLPRYYYESVKAWVQTGDTDNNPFEQEAIQAEEE